MIGSKGIGNPIELFPLSPMYGTRTSVGMPYHVVVNPQDYSGMGQLDFLSSIFENSDGSINIAMVGLVALGGIFLFNMFFGSTAKEKRREKALASESARHAKKLKKIGIKYGTGGGGGGGSYRPPARPPAPRRPSKAEAKREAEFGYEGMGN